MKGFFIEVSNNILDAQHCRQMGRSIWLFMWLLDKITAINNTDGKILGGKPVKIKDIQADLGISRLTCIRWMNILKKYGYISTIRTPYGNCILVLKAKKRFNKKVVEEVSNMEHPDILNIKNQGIKNDTSEVSNMIHQGIKNDTSEVSKMIHGGIINDTSNKTESINNTKNISDDNTTTPPGMVVSDDQKNQKENFTNQLNLVKRFNSPDEIPPELVVETIALFLPVFPSQFTDTKHSPFAIPATRDAVKNLLMRLTVEQIQTLINRYLEGKEETFRPSAGTIHAFCTYKLAAIEAWAKKPIDGLWQHRSISTPDQAKVREEQSRKIIERMRKRRQDFKKAWEQKNLGNQDV